MHICRGLAEAEKRVAYQLGVEETQVRLTEELLEVCKDYCSVTWDKALSVAGVPVDSVQRLLGSVFYPLEIREVPTDAPKSSEQPIAIPDAIPLIETAKGSSQAGEQGQGAEGEKGKGKKLFAKSKDAAQEKPTEAENQGADPQANDVPSSQPSHNEDPPAEAQPLRFLLSFVVELYFCFCFKDIMSERNILFLLLNENAFLFILCPFA